MVCKTPPGRWSEWIRWLVDVNQDNGVSETKRCWRQGENERLMNLELFCHSSLQTGPSVMFDDNDFIRRLSASVLRLRPAHRRTSTQLCSWLCVFWGYCPVVRLPLPLPVGITSGLQHMEKINSSFFFIKSKKKKKDVCAFSFDPCLKCPW